MGSAVETETQGPRPRLSPGHWERPEGSSLSLSPGRSTWGDGTPWTLDLSLGRLLAFSQGWLHPLPGRTGPPQTRGGAPSLTQPSTLQGCPSSHLGPISSALGQECVVSMAQEQLPQAWPLPSGEGVPTQKQLSPAARQVVHGEAFRKAPAVFFRQDVTKGPARLRAAQGPGVCGCVWTCGPTEQSGTRGPPHRAMQLPGSRATGDLPAASQGHTDALLGSPSASPGSAEDPGASWGQLGPQTTK